MSLPFRQSLGVGLPGGTGSSPPPPSAGADHLAPTSASLAQILWRRHVPVLITHALLSESAGQEAKESRGIDGTRAESGRVDDVGGHERKTDSEKGKSRRPSSPQQPGRHRQSLVFAASVPRFGYLAQLLPRLSAFFGLPCSSFHYDGVVLRNLPVGLLVDLYYRPDDFFKRIGGDQILGRQDDGGRSDKDRFRSGPWRLVVSDGDAWHLGDTFLNGAKEADYVRYGSAKQILGLSKANTEALWHAVQDSKAVQLPDDYATFSRVNTLLLSAPTPLKHIPLRIYFPSSASPSSRATGIGAIEDTPPPPSRSEPGSYKIMQTLVAPRTGSRQPQTLGPALRQLMPLLFPSSRDPVLATVILHGAAVPFHTPLEDLMREAAYPDGWLCLIVVLL